MNTKEALRVRHLHSGLGESNTDTYKHSGTIRVMRLMSYISKGVMKPHWRVTNPDQEVEDALLEEDTRAPSDTNTNMYP